MTNQLFYLLCNSIPKSYISVNNDTDFSCYSFFIPKGIGEDAYVEIYTMYSHSDATNSYAKYKLYIDSVLIEESIKPILDEAKTVKNTKTKADKLETLLKMCSTKIILQEVESHKTHMLKSVVNKTNQSTN